jgi:hypothetical protein
MPPGPPWRPTASPPPTGAARRRHWPPGPHAPGASCRLRTRRRGQRSCAAAATPARGPTRRRARSAARTLGRWTDRRALRASRPGSRPTPRSRPQCRHAPTTLCAPRSRDRCEASLAPREAAGTSRGGIRAFGPAGPGGPGEQSPGPTAEYPPLVVGPATGPPGDPPCATVGRLFSPLVKLRLREAGRIGSALPKSPPSLLTAVARPAGSPVPFRRFPGQMRSLASYEVTP